MSEPITPVKDVVCGKTVHPATTPWNVQHDEATYYFCSLSCALAFKAAPAAYLRPDDDSGKA